MKKLVCLFIFCIFCLFSGGLVHAANTVVTDANNRSTMITAMDGDFDWQDVWTNQSSGKSPNNYDDGACVESILFQPGAASDYLQILEGAVDNAPEYLPQLALDVNTTYIREFPECIRRKLIIDFSDSTLTGAYKVVIDWCKCP